MKILQSSEYYFGLGGILVLGKSRSASIKGFIKNFVCVFLMGPFLCQSSGAFIYHHPDQFKSCMKALAAISAGLLTTGKYLSLKLNENQIKMLIKKFRQTVDEAPIEIKKLYFDAETKGRRLTKTAVTMMIVIFVVVMGLCSLFTAIYNIKLGRLDTRKWFQSLFIVLPNDHYTPTEYFIKVGIVLVICYEYAITLTPSVTFLLNCHGLLEVGFSHVNSLFAEMDELALRNSQSNSAQIKIRMVRVVELHVRLLDMAKSLSIILSGPVFFQLLCNVGLMAGCLIFLKIDELDFDTVQSVVGVIPTIYLSFLYCDFATRISTMLDQIGDNAYQLFWYNLPIETQKGIILITRRAQVPFQFNGLKMFDCNMETFVKILRLVSSYYLMLNKINTN